MPDEQEELGRYAKKYLNFLREHHPKELKALLSAGELDERLQQVDDEAEQEYSRIFQQEKSVLKGDETYLDQEAVIRRAAMMADSEVMRNIVLVSSEDSEDEKPDDGEDNEHSSNSAFWR